MAVTGLPHPTSDHAVSAARASVKMMRFLERRNQTHQHKWRARIGIATGSVVGSVVGVQKYIYDVFGPTVTKALAHRSEAKAMTVTADRGFADRVDGKFQISAAPGGADIVLIQDLADTNQPS